MSNSSRSRENRSATTFWMHNDLKNRAQSVASDLKITMTELINKSVEVFLTEGHKLSDDLSQRIAMRAVGKEIESNKPLENRYKQQITDALDGIKGIQARISQLENRMDSLENDETTQIRINKQVQALMEQKVEPIMNIIRVMVEGLDQRMGDTDTYHPEDDI